MLRNIARSAGILFALALSANTFAGAQGISQKVSLDGQAGVAIPGKQLHQFEDAGPNANLELAYHLRPRLAVDAFGDVSMLNGRTLFGTTAPGLDALDYGVGLTANLLGQASHNWLLSAKAGVGATTFRSDVFTSLGSGTTRFSHTYPATTAGLQLGYQFRRIGAFIGSDLRWTFVRQDDTGPLTDVNGLAIQPFNKAWIAPITVGLHAII
jgi:hypothetical protein